MSLCGKTPHLLSRSLTKVASACPVQVIPAHSVLRSASIIPKPGLLKAFLSPQPASEDDEDVVILIKSGREPLLHFLLGRDPIRSRMNGRAALGGKCTSYAQAALWNVTDDAIPDSLGH